MLAAAVPDVAAAWEKLNNSDGILVPGGFGNRGVEGKILAANYARVNDRPYLGICLGMQVRCTARSLRTSHTSSRGEQSSTPVSGRFGGLLCPGLTAKA